MELVIQSGMKELWVDNTKWLETLLSGNLCLKAKKKRKKERKKPRNRRLPVIHQNDQDKGKEERYSLYVLQAFQKTWSCSFGHVHANLQERWYCGHQGNGHCSKRTAPNVTMAKLEEPVVFPSMLLALLSTNKLRARFWPRELTYVPRILSAPRAKIACRNVGRKVKKRKKPKRKAPGFNRSANLLHPKTRSRGERVEKTLRHQNLFHKNSWFNRCKK